MCVCGLQAVVMCLNINYLFSRIEAVVVRLAVVATVMAVVVIVMVAVAAV